MSILLPTTPSRSKLNSSLHSTHVSSHFEDIQKSCSTFTHNFNQWLTQTQGQLKQTSRDFQGNLETLLGSFFFFSFHIIIFLINSIKKNNKNNKKGY